MADEQHLQNAAAALAASTLGHHTATRNVTPAKGAELYFAYFDALVNEDNKRGAAAEAGGGVG